MKNAIELVNDPRYQSLVLQHIRFEAPAFIQNPVEVKAEFLFNDADPDAIAHDTTIKNAYAFLNTGQGVFALATSPITGQPQVIFLDDEAQIQIVGTTPFDFVINLEYLTIDYETHDLDGFLAACRAQFGDIGALADFASLNG